MRKSSRTAIGVAALRAAHQLVDAEPRVLDDPVVLKLLGIETLDTIREDRARYQTPGSLALRSHIVLRSRYAEDRLAQSVARGVTQYVILGAGLDTFAYRQPAWAKELRIVEIDRAAMQEQKKERLSLSRVFVPDNVIFASIDFEREKLADTLTKYGARPGQADVFLVARRDDVSHGGSGLRRVARRRALSQRQRDRLHLRAVADGRR